MGRLKTYPICVNDADGTADSCKQVASKRYNIIAYTYNMTCRILYFRSCVYADGLHKNVYQNGEHIFGVLNNIQVLFLFRRVLMRHVNNI